MHGQGCQRGFGLIELMVTLAIIAGLAMLPIPFSARWMDSDRQLQARGQLVEAVGLARSLSLRNAASAARGTPVTCLRLVGNGVLEVATLASGQACPAGGTVVWRVQLQGPVTLAETGTGTPFRCVAFDSRGAPAMPALAPACSLAPRLQVIGRDPAEALHVDLL